MNAAGNPPPSPAEAALLPLLAALAAEGRPLEATYRRGGWSVRLVVQPDGPGDAAPAPFVPNGFQALILEALDGKGLRTDALGHKVGDRGRLFRKPGALPELLHHGLVAHHRRVGYYRPAAPPPELRT